MRIKLSQFLKIFPCKTLLCPHKQFYPSVYYSQGFIKGTVSVILDNLQRKDNNARFKTVTLKLYMIKNVGDNVVFLTVNLSIEETFAENLKMKMNSLKVT